MPQSNYVYQFCLVYEKRRVEQGIAVANTDVFAGDTEARTHEFMSNVIKNRDLPLDGLKHWALREVPASLVESLYEACFISGP